MDYVLGGETRFVNHPACKGQAIAMQGFQLSRVSPACEGDNLGRAKKTNTLKALISKGLAHFGGYFTITPFETVTQSNKWLTLLI